MAKQRLGDNPLARSSGAAWVGKAVAEEEAPKEALQPTRWKKKPAPVPAEDLVQLNGRVPREMKRRFVLLSAEEEKSQQDLMAEAITLLFKKYEKK